MNRELAVAEPLGGGRLPEHTASTSSNSRSAAVVQRLPAVEYAADVGVEIVGHRLRPSARCR